MRIHKHHVAIAAAIAGLTLQPALLAERDKGAKQRYEQEREASKHEAELEREHYKHVNEIERERRKHFEQMERERLKRIREREREAYKTEKEYWKRVKENEREAREHLGGPYGRGEHGPVGGSRGTVFRTSDLEVIIDYFRGEGRPFKGAVPPPNVSRLRRGDRIPDDFRGRVKALPADLARQLEPASGGMRMGLLGDRAIIYDPETLSILDAVIVASSAFSKR